MQLFIATLLRVALAPLTKALVGAIGPLVRSATAYGLSTASLGTVFGFVAMRFKGELPKYTALDALTAEDVADLVTGLHEATKAVLVEYKFVLLTDAQVGMILEAVAARIPVRFPAAV